MQLTQHQPETQYFIHSLRAEAVRIVDRDYASSLLLSPEHGVRDWPVDDVSTIGEAEVAPILELQPDVVLLATGRSMKVSPPELQIMFAKQGIGLEAMPLDAAARTFNILASEGRSVVAALIWEADTSGE